MEIFYLKFSMNSYMNTILNRSSLLERQVADTVFFKIFPQETGEDVSICSKNVDKEMTLIESLIFINISSGSKHHKNQ